VIYGESAFRSSQGEACGGSLVRVTALYVFERGIMPLNRVEPRITSSLAEAEFFYVRIKRDLILCCYVIFYSVGSADWEFLYEFKK
jgi:hypothetical protein